MLVMTLFGQTHLWPFIGERAIQIFFYKKSDICTIKNFKSMRLPADALQNLHKVHKIGDL